MRPCSQNGSSVTVNPRIHLRESDVKFTWSLLLVIPQTVLLWLLCHFIFPLIVSPSLSWFLFWIQTQSKKNIHVSNSTSTYLPLLPVLQRHYLCSQWKPTPPFVHKIFSVLLKDTAPAIPPPILFCIITFYLYTRSDHFHQHKTRCTSPFLRRDKTKPSLDSTSFLSTVLLYSKIIQ